MRITKTASPWQVDNWFDTSFLQLLGVANTRALQNQWRAQCATAYDYLLPSSEDSGLGLSLRQWLSGHSLDTNGNAVLDDDLVNFGVAHKVQIRMMLPGAMDVCVSRVRTASGITIDPL